MMMKHLKRRKRQVPERRRRKVRKQHRISQRQRRLNPRRPNLRKPNLRRKLLKPKHLKKIPQSKKRRQLTMKFLLLKRRIRTQSTSKLVVWRTRSLLSTLIVKRNRITKKLT